MNKRVVRYFALAVSATLFCLASLPVLAAKEEPRQVSFGARDKLVNAPPTGGGTVDFSEADMLAEAYATGAPYGYKKAEGVTYAADSGGTAQMAAAYYARWGGPALESAAVYPPSASAVIYQANAQTIAQVTDIVMIPHNDADNSDDILRIKEAVQRYGAAYLSMQYQAAYLNSATASYYMPVSAMPGANYGHAVTVVGWDDTYPKERFKLGLRPTKDGAFLVKNSYGTSDASDGYFYIAYEDKVLGRTYQIAAGGTVYGSTTSVFIAGTGDYDTNYQHDPYGYNSAYALSGTTQSYYMANVFTAQKSETVSAVSFYTRTQNVRYEVFVVTGATTAAVLPDTAALASAAASGVQGYAGYHTVPLAAGAAVAAGQRFSVIVKLYTDGVSANLLVPTEANTGSERSFFALAGESFLNSGGSSWTDLGDTAARNLCVKAFTRSGAVGGAAEPAGRSEPDIGASQAAGEEDPPVIGSSEPAPRESDASDITSGPVTATGFSELPAREGEEPAPGHSDPEQKEHPPGMIPEEPGLYDLSESEPPTGGDLPARFDLRDAGVNTPVKNQGSIGACWTFAATASAESTYLLQRELFAGRVEIAKSGLFLSQAGGQTLTLTAAAVKPELVESYLWTMTEGERIAGILPDENTCEVIPWSNNLEGAVTVRCMVTYQNGQKAEAAFTFAAANYGTGTDGSAAHPYEVSTPENLALLGLFAGSESGGVYFRQTKDIDLTGKNWTPIATYTEALAFEGHYDGGGFAISNMTISQTRPAAENTGLGLFSSIEGGSVKNVVLYNASITVNAAQGGGNYIIGLLAGRADGGAGQNYVVENCSVTGKISVTLAGSGNTYSFGGGLIGMLVNTSLTRCEARTEITQKGGYWGEYGGLSDYAYNSTLTQCSGDVKMTLNGQAAIAAMAGLVYESRYGQYTDCYAICDLAAVGAPQESDGAGLMVFSVNDAITRCYTAARVTGTKGTKDAFVSYNFDTALSFCYFNRTLAAANGLSVSNASENQMKGLTTAQMQRLDLYGDLSWDFDTVWAVSGFANGGLPVYKRPVVQATGLTIGDSVKPRLYLPDRVNVEVTMLPPYASPQALTLEAGPEEHLSLFGATLIPVARGDGSVTVFAGAVAATKEIRVDQRRGDLDGNGTVDTSSALTRIASLLTGRTLTGQDYYLLDIDRSSIQDFTAEKSDITILDLLELKQYASGVKEINP